VVDQNLRYRDLFFEAIPPGVFTVRQIHCLDRARAVCSDIADMASEDGLGSRFASLRELLVFARGAQEAEGWDLLTAALPAGMSLAEVRDYMWADTAEQQWTILAATCRRLDLDPPAMPPEGGVRVMSMHGAKGLQADVVFIPGLEDQILPGPRRDGVPGLVLEGARLLYVSMTRARAALILSFAGRRYWSGSMRDHDPSRYTSHLGGRFTYRAPPLTPAEVEMITAATDAR
jgi:DNA helicase II / ATP-dependent DNA helicase PcrA